ncbi:unnamed protein product, partial [Adineta ricciae]
NANVKIIDNQRLCVKSGEEQQCGYVAGNLLYFQGRHFINLMTSFTNGRIGFIGIRPANLPIDMKPTKNFLPMSSTFGIDDKCLVMNGQCIDIALRWSTLCPKNTFHIELDCGSRTMHIIRRQYYTNDTPPPSKFIDLTLAPLPWQLFIVLRDQHDYVRLML